MKNSDDTKDKYILDKILILLKYIKTIYVCKIILELIEFFN